jgi:phospholipid/cholesterol/gamma-HCH transport system substrate-binding protein
MTTQQQKIRVGVFAVVAGGLFGVVLVVFGGFHLWQHRNHYYIVFTESVAGLEEGAGVTLNGIPVGAVRSIKIEPDDIRNVRVEIAIDDDAPIRTDAKATLTMGGLTGSKSIDLRAGTPAAPHLASGGTIALAEGTIDKIERQALVMVDQSTELMAHANRIVTQTEHMVANMSELTDASHLGEVVVQSRIAATNLAQASSTMRVMIEENRIQLHTSIASIDHAARSVTELLDGKVAGIVANFADVVGQLKTSVRDNGSLLASTMSDLRQASRSLKEFARALRDKPSRLLFSGSEPDRKLQ